MSPILLRPIREQIEHDRVIRQLEVRWRRRYETAINIGRGEEAPVKVGKSTCYPDIVLTTTTGGRRLHGVVEVETAESINHLEAMAEWAHFAKARGAFYLYVPAGFTDVAERLCRASKINVTEIWAYYAIGSEVKYSMEYRSPRGKLAAKQAAAKPKPKPKPKTKAKPKPKAKAQATPKAKLKPKAKAKAKPKPKAKAVKKRVVVKKVKKKKTTAKRKK
jgi:hypothetical protein